MLDCNSILVPMFPSDHPYLQMNEDIISPTGPPFPSTAIMNRYSREVGKDKILWMRATDWSNWMSANLKLVQRVMRSNWGRGRGGKRQMLCRLYGQPRITILTWRTISHWVGWMKFGVKYRWCLSRNWIVICAPRKRIIAAWSSPPPNDHVQSSGGIGTRKNPRENRNNSRSSLFRPHLQPRCDLLTPSWGWLAIVIAPKAIRALVRWGTDK